MTTSIFIEKTVYGGDGLGRLGDGRVVFVPGAFTGERVKAELGEEKKNFVRARLIEVLEPSEHRLSNESAPIPGMVYSNLSFAGEQIEKEAQLRNFLSRARFDASRLVGCEKPNNFLHYRNKVVYHFEKKDNKWSIGYRVEPEHTVLDVVEDPLACNEINAKLPEIRRNVLALLTQGSKNVRDALARQGNVTIRYTRKSGVQWWIGHPMENLVLKEVTCGKTFEVPGDGFYQVNPEVGEALVKAVISEFASHPTKNLLDLYCGVGVFGLCVAPEKLIGIESGRRAVAFAEKNARAQNFLNAKFFASQVAHSLREIKNLNGDETTIIVDPPRGGLEKSVSSFLAQENASRIFYVSCDPATMIRDLKVIARAYEIESVRWFNMFPRTARFETLVVLKRK